MKSKSRRFRWLINLIYLVVLMAGVIFTLRLVQRNRSLVVADAGQVSHIAQCLAEQGSSCGARAYCAGVPSGGCVMEPVRSVFMPGYPSYGRTQPIY
jgi:hypothetical protein